MSDRPFNMVSFEAFLQEEKLMGARCKACDQIFSPPRPLCPNCSRTTLEWIELSGKGRLKTFTNIAVVPPQMARFGYGRKNPYCSGVVELEEKCCVVARIEGIDLNRPEVVQIGQDLQIRFLQQGEGLEAKKVLAFAPAT